MIKIEDQEEYELIKKMAENLCISLAQDNDIERAYELIKVAAEDGIELELTFY